MRRCRVLFALALCAWLALAGSVFAQPACCADMAGMATIARHDGVPAPLHADGLHADCACAHLTAATLPELAASAWPLRFAIMAWPAWQAATPELPRAPPLRPPLA